MFTKILHRPALAIVISLLILFLVGLSIVTLPFSQFPYVAPVVVMVTLDYPGASAKVLEESCLIPLERSINGVPNMLSFDLKAGETKYVRATLNISKMSALNNGAQIGGLLGLAVAYAVSGDAKKNDVFLDVVPKQTAIRELYTTRKVTNCKKPS